MVHTSISTMIAAMRNIDAIKQDGRPNITPAINVTSGRASGRYSRGAGTSSRAQQLPIAPPVQALSSQPQIPPPSPPQPFNTDVVITASFLAEISVSSP